MSRTFTPPTSLSRPDHWPATASFASDGKGLVEIVVGCASLRVAYMDLVEFMGEVKRQTMAARIKSTSAEKLLGLEE